MTDKGDSFMKKISMVILIVMSLFLYGSHVIAAEKTGFVDIRAIMVKSMEGRKASEDIAKVYEKNKAMIQAKETELKKLKDELEKQRTVLKEDAMKEKEAAYQKKFRDYQLVVKDANEELQRRDQELSKKLIPDIIKIVKKIGEREKYTAIIDVSTPGVVYHAQENELTNKVVEEFNKTHKP
jgi:outer membrane protein